MNLLALVIFTIFVSQNMARIIISGQNERQAEIYSSIELTCGLEAQKSGIQLMWRKIDGV